MKNKAFTLIELLVVIVIIGILATISTATFNGYFAQARDIERQSFIQNARQILIATQITKDIADYTNLDGNGTMGGLDLAADIQKAFEAQGLAFPIPKNGHTYTYIADSSDFAIAVCKEEDDTQMFAAGTAAALSWINCNTAGQATVEEVVSYGGLICTTTATTNVITCDDSSF